MEKETLNEALEKTFTSIKEYKEFKNHLNKLFYNLNRIFPLDTAVIILNKILNFDLSFLKKNLENIESDKIFNPFITQRGGNKYNYIIDPKNYEKIPISSKKAKYIIIKYISNLLNHF